MNNSAMSRQIDTNTMCLTLVCVTIVLSLYLGVDIMLICSHIDLDAIGINSNNSQTQLVFFTIAQAASFVA